MARVLVVEDDADLLFLYATALAQRGIECVQAETAAHALSYLHQEDFDAVILDLNLPDAHGSVIIDDVLQHKPALIERMMVITANDRWLDNISSRGVQHILVKPLSMVTMLDLLRKIIGK